MKIVEVKASRNYQVVIGRGVLNQIQKTIKAGQKVAVITDETVAKLYLEQLNGQLKEVGAESESFIFPPGEASKNIMVLAEILEWLADRELTRSDVVIALGGGVTGDMAGFAASIYLRGIPYIQIPTTFLAAIDSSVGGKTAIDLKAGKNLAGSFYQPKQVICDIDLLDSLPAEIFADGMAEALKYGILGDLELFEQLAEGKVKEQIEEIIYKCVSMKRDVVGEDEFDNGKRQLLNLGHTFGHCVERLSDYQISHGNAVAMGMAIMARAAVGLGMMAAEEEVQIASALKKNNLPTTCTYHWQQMQEVMQRDKKRRGDEITLIVPRAIGHCVLQTVTLAEAGRYLQLGIEGE